ncbi:MAG: AAA family ATPase [Lachnospiraceae bacterium]|nr:AAA family ATPase [Lachnospiraceae bacterium]
MNIKQAKEYIKDSVVLYLKKDDFGEYKIPVVRQRPIFLLGAPGIGKTAVMEQIAQEMGIALVSYSMTHHTRQSALGLPFIRHKEYGEEEFDVSEYTMSEIISSVYETMEESGVREGILFLDEINCVSETLSPSMLQFLQYKVFGRHKVPEGWVIVTAGNPPEYNKSVREFDVATLDRLRVMEVEPDFKVWKEYAQEKAVHPVVMNFLELKKEYFYAVETTVKGRSYVTARGWEDLSEILLLYEAEKKKADETLVGQYIRNERIVKEFTAYYDLYNKYKKDYRIEDILAGQPTEAAKEKAKKAAFDERLSLLSMLLDKVTDGMKEVMETSDYLSDLMSPLKALKQAVEKGSTEEGKSTAKEAGSDNLIKSSADVVLMLEKQVQAREQILRSMQKANALSNSDRRKHRQVIFFLESMGKELYLGEETGGADAFAKVKSKFDAEVTKMKEVTEKVKKQLHFLFAFVEEVFAEGNEMLVLVTELTVNTYAAKFIARFGSEDYQKHNQELMLTERQNDMLEQIKNLNI